MIKQTIAALLLTTTFAAAQEAVVTVDIETLVTHEDLDEAIAAIPPGPRGPIGVAGPSGTNGTNGKDGVVDYDRINRGVAAGHAYASSLAGGEGIGFSIAGDFDNAGAAISVQKDQWNFGVSVGDEPMFVGGFKLKF